MGRATAYSAISIHFVVLVSAPYPHVLDAESDYAQPHTPHRSPPPLDPLAARGLGHLARSGGVRLLRRHATPPPRLLDPPERVTRADPRLPDDERGQGRHIQPVLRPIRRSEPCRGRGPESRRRQLLAGTRRHTTRQGRPLSLIHISEPT